MSYLRNIPSTTFQICIISSFSHERGTDCSMRTPSIGISGKKCHTIQNRNRIIVHLPGAPTQTPTRELNGNAPFLRIRTMCDQPVVPSFKLLTTTLGILLGKNEMKQSTEEQLKTLPSRQEEGIPDVESVPSLTTLQAELSGVHNHSFNPVKGNLALDVSDNKLDALKDNVDYRHSHFPSPGNGLKKELSVMPGDNSERRSHTMPSREEADIPEIESVPSLTTLQAELSDVHNQSFNPAKGNLVLDVSDNKLDALNANSDHRSQTLPSKKERDGSPELERLPSLTTLRAELSNVHVKSFNPGKGNLPLDVSATKLDALHGNEDLRHSHFPSPGKGLKKEIAGRGIKKELSLLSDD